MTTLILIAVSYVLGAVTGYLVLRNNPKVKAALDTATDKAETAVDQLKS